MSTHRLKLHVDQENQHKVAPAKNELRNSNGRESVNNSAPLGAKRPLSAKGNANEKRLRVPLGGKDQNKVFAGLQRSKSSLPSTFHVSALKSENQGSVRLPLANPPTLTKSNSSLGFFNRPAKLSAPPAANPRTANPHKNTLFPAEDSHRSKDLVPRFSSDTLTKAPTRELPVLSNSLQSTFSDATAGLHASKLDTSEHFARNVDPMKKGARGIEMERILEALAEDEDSIETVPERPVSAFAGHEDVPLGCSPLSREQAPFLYQDTPPSAPLLTAQFAPDTVFFSEDEDEELCSETEAAHNMAFHEELTSGDGGDNSLGLTEAELHDLLDF